MAAAIADSLNFYDQTRKYDDKVEQLKRESDRIYEEYKKSSTENKMKYYQNKLDYKKVILKDVLMVLGRLKIADKSFQRLYNIILEFSSNLDDEFIIDSEEIPLFEQIIDTLERRKIDKNVIEYLISVGSYTYPPEDEVDEYAYDEN